MTAMGENGAVQADEREADADLQSPTRPPSAALAEYTARLKRPRIVYAVVIVVAIVAALVVTRIAFDRGEISHAQLKTAASAAPAVPLTDPPATLTQAWTSQDDTAIGTPYWRGTVVTFSAHTVSGRNALTGAVRWSYTRSDRTVCTAAQIQGITVAVYELAGNCDEVTALDSGTGARKWNRTLDMDTHAVNGHPTYSVTPYTFMVTTKDVVYAIDPVSGYNRWLFSRTGCTINSAILGTAGALISQNCTNPSCADQKFCGKGEQLLLRDPTTGQADNGTNRDQLKWNLIGSTLHPASADSVISAVQPGSTQLTVLDAVKGTTLSTLALKAPADAVPSAATTARAELVHTGGYTYAIEQTGTAFFWTAPTTALPTATASDAAATPDLSSAHVAVSSAQGIDMLDGGNGTIVRTFPVSPPPTGSLVYAFGAGFIVAGSNTTVYQ
jgi:hypothetical protein